MQVTAQVNDTRPTIEKCVIAPVGEAPTICPLVYAASPDANCCTDEFTLMNPPRYRASMVAVISAMAGTMRPDMQIIRSVDVPIANTSGTRGRFVSSRIGTLADTDMI